jgi:hypothetical protein
MAKWWNLERYLIYRGKYLNSITLVLRGTIQVESSFYSPKIRSESFKENSTVENRNEPLFWCDWSSSNFSSRLVVTILYFSLFLFVSVAHMDFPSGYLCLWVFYAVSDSKENRLYTYLRLALALISVWFGISEQPIRTKVVTCRFDVVFGSLHMHMP